MFSPQDSASSLTVPQNDRQSSRLALLPIPVIALVLAFTAVPTEFRSLSHHRIRDFFGIGLDDFVANLVGYVPVGAVLANLGTGTAIGLAFSVSVFAETMQLFSEGRSSQLTDVAANVIGAALGVALCSRLRIDLSRVVVGKRAAALAGVLAAVYVGSGTAISPQDVTNAVAVVAAVPPWRQVNSQGPIAPGRLEAWWTFDAETGRTIPDTSANQLSGVLVNQPPFVTGVAGRAIGLDGASQWIDFGDPVSLRLTGSMTISAWINPSSFPRDDAAIVSNLSPRLLGYQLDTTIDEGPRTIGFKLADSSGRLMARYGKTPLATHQWYHVAGVYDAEARTLDVYLNGRSDNGCLRGHVTTRQHASGFGVFVGRRAGDTGFEFAGAIDDVRIYSRALAQAEIESMTEDIVSPGMTVASDLKNNPNASDGPCRSEERTVPRIAGPLVALGMLVAFACVGLWPTSTYHRAGVILGLLAGFAVIPSLAPIVPPVFLWVVPILTIAGGASVALSSRQ